MQTQAMPFRFERCIADVISRAEDEAQTRDP